MRYPFASPLVLFSCSPSNVYRDGHYTDEQATDKKTGRRLWSALVGIDNGGMRLDRLRISIASDEDPAEGIEKGELVELVGGAVNWWNFSDGRTVVKVTADGLRAVA